MKLKIYTDESLTQVREEREVPRMKIPYRTADAVLEMLGDLDFNNLDEYKVISLVLKNKNHLTAVVRATFGLSEEDLAHVDIMELGDLARDIIRYVVEKMAALGLGESDPNAQKPATI